MVERTSSGQNAPLLWWSMVQDSFAILVDAQDTLPPSLRDVLPQEIHVAMDAAKAALLASVPPELHGPLTGELPVTTRQGRARR